MAGSVSFFPLPVVVAPSAARGGQRRLGLDLGTGFGRRGRSTCASAQTCRNLLGILPFLGKHEHALAQRHFLAGRMIDVRDDAVVV